MNKKMYVMRVSTGEYWCGYNSFDKQLRKAKIYHSLKYINEVAEKYKDLNPEILEVELAVIRNANEVCKCYQEVDKKSYCMGTKECDECSCNGDKSICTFYPEES